MKEATFSAEFRRDVRKAYPKSHVYLVMDAPRSGRKPYDAIALVYGEFHAIEFKVVFERAKSVRQDCVGVHQLQYLREVLNAGGYAHIVILVEREKAVCFTPDEWEAFWHEYPDDTVSVKYARMIQSHLGRVVVRKKVKGKKRWYVEELI